MPNVKHVGKMKTGQKVVVLFRTVPDETHNCLVTETARLPSAYHDRLMELVESDEGQQSSELADLLSRRFFADGENVLSTLHSRGYIKKVNTANVLLTPNSKTAVALSDVNEHLLKTGSNEAKNITAAFKGSATDDGSVVENKPVALDTSDLAHSLLLQAERYEKEAQDLRKQAEELMPTNVKKTTRRRKPKAG